MSLSVSDEIGSTPLKNPTPCSILVGIYWRIALSYVFGGIFCRTWFGSDRDDAYLMTRSHRGLQKLQLSKSGWTHRLRGDVISQPRESLPDDDDNLQATFAARHWTELRKAVSVRAGLLERMVRFALDDDDP